MAPTDIFNMIFIFLILDIQKLDRMANYQLTKIFFVFAIIELVRSHGYLSDPKARNGANNGLYCGGRWNFKIINLGYLAQLYSTLIIISSIIVLTLILSLLIKKNRRYCVDFGVRTRNIGYILNPGLNQKFGITEERLSNLNQSRRLLK